jgi:uroporphyrinogen decarboxylase
MLATHYSLTATSCLMTSRERFLAALACQPLDRPPVWIMRQAGRYLPEYRALKGKSSFLEMVKTPELAAEVTLQPLRRFALDAAIIFSDILVIPEAMGQGYKFRDAGGIEMDFRLETKAQLDRLDPVGVQFRLDYVGQALARVKAELKGEKALLGFGGSPWTLATYMLEGGSADDFGRSKTVFHSDRAFFDALMTKLTAALIEYFQMQIRAGADAIQIFDSWGGILAGQDYEAASLRWIRDIIAALPKDFPIILYAKGTPSQFTDQAFSACPGSRRGLDRGPRRRPQARAGQHRPPRQPRSRAHEHRAGHRPPRDDALAGNHARLDRPHLQPRPRHHAAGQDRMRRSPG